MRLRKPLPIVTGKRAFACPRHDAQMSLAHRHYMPEQHETTMEDSVGIGVWFCYVGRGYWWEDGQRWFRLTITP